MAISTRAIFVATIVICSFLAVCEGDILFSTLKKSIEVKADHKAGGMCCANYPF